MKILQLAALITLSFWVVETFFSWFQNRQRRHWQEYIILFFLMVAACGAGKLYGQIEIGK